MLGRLLDLMSDGEFHSGEWLGQQLGVSRAAVWKSLKKLESDGYPLQRIRGRGYRAPRGVSMLEAAKLRSHLVAGLQGHWEWAVCTEIDSTNAEVQRRLSGGVLRRIACVSEQQLNGRGRRGRSWASPFAQNIYLTLAEPFESGAQRLEGLSLVVGLALVEALEDAGYRDCALKWPNDIMLGGRKLAGVLIEIAGDLSSDCVAVIGVGINVLMTRSADITQQWTSLLLSRQEGELDRNRLVALFLIRLEASLQLFRQEGFAPFAERWATRDAWAGLPVRVISGDTAIEGVNIGVTSGGALRLRVEDEEMLVHGGEVSLRLSDAS